MQISRRDALVGARARLWPWPGCLSRYRPMTRTYLTEIRKLWGELFELVVKQETPPLKVV